ncbi:MAG: MotA/TolQ/ExbB proton channel family protein [Bacteroidota bacterium]
MLGILLQITQGTPIVHDTVAAAVQTTQQPPLQVSLSLWELILKGGIIMIPIFICSILAVYFFIERFIALRKAGKSDKNFMTNIDMLVSDMKLDAAKTMCKTTNSPVSRMVEKGLARIGRPINDIERNVENVGKYEISKLERNMKILGIVAGIAPMLGFIGTIMGVIKIFYNISLTDNISIGDISSGLYEKMITSASGLIVGVLAYVGYHYLQILLDKVIFKLENAGIEFMDILQKEA